jgi:hypothetical protein
LATFLLDFGHLTELAAWKYMRDFDWERLKQALLKFIDISVSAGDKNEQS